MQEEILRKLAQAVLEGDADKASDQAGEALRNKVDPMTVLEEGLSKGMATVGEQFENGDAFLPELLMASNAFNAAMAVLKPEMQAQSTEATRLGRVLIGTVKGDVHNLGKNIVATFLETHGFEVIDLGTDVGSLNFVEEAEKSKADVIALSSLMTTTMPGQKEVIDTLNEMKVRHKYFVVVGGGPVNQGWSDQIGADGYGRGAPQAVELIKGLLGKKG